MSHQNDLEFAKDVLFFAGPQWGNRSPEHIISALDAAGLTIVRKSWARDTLAKSIISILPSSPSGWQHCEFRGMLIFACSEHEPRIYDEGKLSILKPQPQP